MITNDHWTVSTAASALQHHSYKVNSASYPQQVRQQEDTVDNKCIKLYKLAPYATAVNSYVPALQQV